MRAYNKANGRNDLAMFPTISFFYVKFLHIVSSMWLRTVAYPNFLSNQDMLRWFFGSQFIPKFRSLWIGCPNLTGREQTDMLRHSCVQSWFQIIFLLADFEKQGAASSQRFVFSFSLLLCLYGETWLESGWQWLQLSKDFRMVFSCSLSKTKSEDPRVDPS